MKYPARSAPPLSRLRCAVVTDSHSPASNGQMLTRALSDSLRLAQWRKPVRHAALLALYLLMTVQFVGCYLFLGRPYIDLDRFGHGYERLPFQTRLLLAPLFRWAQDSPTMVRIASDWSKNNYFFPHGIGPGGVVQFYLDLPCVIVAGWVAVQLYNAASRRRLLSWLVYPLFLLICTISYILHIVQNYRFIYDMPSLMLFSLGLYLIYFRKPIAWLVALFAVATWNRETTLLLLPFFVLSACVRGQSEPGARPAEQHGLALTPRWSAQSVPPHSSFVWQRALRPSVVIPVALMLAYWAAWHVLVFHLFRHNSSEYYPRITFNVYCFKRLRYYPQLLAACGYLLPFLFIFRRRIRDAQLRIWLWVIPLWYALMAVWGILVETRVFGELAPFVACASTLIAEESLAAAMARRGAEPGTAEEDDAHLAHAA